MLKVDSTAKRILVIGNGNSIFVKDFIYRYSARGVTVDLLSLAPCERLATVNCQFDCRMQTTNLFGKFGRFLNITFQIANSLRKLSHSYDCVVIHYINLVLFPHVFSLKKKTGNLVSVVHGSDYYRSSWLADRFKSIIYLASNLVVFTNPKTRNDFQKKYSSLPSAKLRLARFGLPVLDEIDQVKLCELTKVAINKRFNFPDNKVIILVGYSASNAHRQDLVIRSVAKLPTEIKDQIHLVFPLGYGDAKVEDGIREELGRSGISDFSVLNEFYDFVDSAKLRCVTDILVNIQPSDQFSGSMQETLYAGGKVIAGAWLPYQELIDVGCSIVTVTEPDQVGKAIEDLLKTSAACSFAPTEGVKDFIQTASSWSRNIKIWDEILYSGCRNGSDPV